MFLIEIDYGDSEIRTLNITTGDYYIEKTYLYPKIYTILAKIKNNSLYRSYNINGIYNQKLFNFIFYIYYHDKIKGSANFYN